MQELTGQQRKHLRKLAHKLKPVVFVGKNGITPTVIEAANVALEAQELIKVKFIDKKEIKRELTDELAKGSKSHCVGIIGNIATLYREQSDEEKRKIEL